VTHIERSDFLKFFTKPDRNLHATIARHLLDGCLSCLAMARQVLWDDLHVSAPSSHRDLAAVLLDQAAVLKDEHRRAAARWARVADLGEKQRLEALKNVRGMRNYGFAVYALDEAVALGKDQAEKAAGYVRLSAAVGDLLSVRVYGSRPLADLRLRQHTTLGHIRRLQLDFPRAFDALDKAELVQHGGIDPAERARYFRTKASLLYDLGDFEESAKSAHQAVGLYADMLDHLSKGKALVQEARSVMLFDPRTALDLTYEALPLLLEPRSVLLGTLTRCICLAKLGESEEAETLLWSQRALVRKIGEAEPVLWFKYIEALILKANGKVADADALLRFVALRFREEGNILAMVVQHLERIRIKADTGRWKSALTIAVRLTPDLARLGLRNDLLGMWANLQDGLSQRRDVVNEFENLLRRSWYPHPRRSRRSFGY